MMFTTAIADVNTGSCKDMLQGYLTGQLSSALGAYQVEALRREFKSFTDVMEKSMKLFKDKIDTDMKTVKGKSSYLECCYQIIFFKYVIKFISMYSQ